MGGQKDRFAKVVVPKVVAGRNPDQATIACLRMADVATALTPTPEGRAIVRARLDPGGEGSRAILAEVAVLGRPMPVRPKF